MSDSTGFTLPSCLPNLTDLHVIVFSSKAQAVLDLPCLQKLNLELLRDAAPVGLGHSTLLVPPSSSLQELNVWGSAKPDVQLYIRKPDLKFSCSMIEVRYNWPELHF